MMNEFEAQVLSDLCVLKTQMTGLVGDGNSGRIHELERRIERHEVNLQRAKGFMAAVSVRWRWLRWRWRRCGGSEVKVRGQGQVRGRVRGQSGVRL